MTETPKFADLVACPLCGALDGYVLAEGSTFRWWSVRCAKCGQEVSEARAAYPAVEMLRTARADVAWNAAGQHSHELVLEIRKLRNALSNAVKLAEDRLAQMKADRAQALQWRDEAERLRIMFVSVCDGLESYSSPA